MTPLASGCLCAAIRPQHNRVPQKAFSRSLRVFHANTIWKLPLRHHRKRGAQLRSDGFLDVIKSKRFSSHSALATCQLSSHACSVNSGAISSSSFDRFFALIASVHATAAVNVLDASSESMAAFQVFLYGRFWVFTEAPGCPLLDVLISQK